jgi:hypothetical protein
MRGEWRLRRRRGSGIIVSAWMPCIVTSHPIVAAKQRSCYQLLLPKDENPEKPWAETGVPPVVRPGAAMRPHACGWMPSHCVRIAIRLRRSTVTWRRWAVSGCPEAPMPDLNGRRHETRSLHSFVRT